MAGMNIRKAEIARHAEQTKKGASENGDPWQNKICLAHSKMYLINGPLIDNRGYPSI